MICSFVDFEEILKVVLLLLSIDMQNIFIDLEIYMYNKIKGSGAH